LEEASQESKGSASDQNKSCNSDKDEERKEEDLRYRRVPEIILSDDDNNDYQIAPLGQIIEEERKRSRTPERQEVEIGVEISISSKNSSFKRNRSNSER